MLTLPFRIAAGRLRHHGGGNRMNRQALAALAALALGWSLPSHAQVTTPFSLDSSNASIGTLSVDAPSLTNTTVLDNGLEPGDTDFDTVTETFVPAESGTYIFGQSAAPADTAMLVYEGGYDPANPAANLLAFNDDWQNQADGSDILEDVPPVDIEFVGCPEDVGLSTRCPAVKAPLTANTPYVIVISTFSPSASLSFPMDFFVYGPAGVAVGAPSAEPTQIPTLSSLGLILLAGLLGAFGVAARRQNAR